MKKIEENARCSIDGCSCNDDSMIITLKMQIIFLTEQIDGFIHKPYFCMKSINLCKKHLDIALSGKQIFATGFREHNRYFFKEGEQNG